MYKGIDYKAMVERAKKLNKVTIKHTDLMTNEEKDIWQNLEKNISRLNTITICFATCKK